MSEAFQAPPTYSCQLQVRWADFDQLRHVNNTKFVEYAQEARLLYFREKFFERGVAVQPMVIRTMTVDFLRPLEPENATVRVDLDLLSLGRTSYGMRHRMYDKENQLCCTIDAVLVSFDPQAGTAVAMSEEFKENFYRA